ncbi:unnamed protein product [Gongylonema pulchrum]|uniref:Uncharacterized protein n=1 Tax=Gongylonema pulchrum TaxID=637853 RepID=A0A183ETI7_9BILA|nr:unnamed protein product [Gongylonema pulchrum]
MEVASQSALVPLRRHFCRIAGRFLDRTNTESGDPVCAADRLKNQTGTNTQTKQLLTYYKGASERSYVMIRSIVFVWLA